ncbi:MAG: WecB/TagA/CpsF family glycosyltransferase [Candidatus Moranbacteria bacterium]|nr:WecB/TagA/CpsF family glycosyltransferase [Candidatus Moranbacteria bacterium]
MAILGIEMSSLTKKEILEHLRAFLDEPKFHRIATVNPEFLLLAEKNTAFRQSLLDADLRVADGFGIILAGFFSGQRMGRFPGADLMEEIIRISNGRGLSVYFAVRKDGLSSYGEVRAAILKKYPNIKIFGRDLERSESRNWKVEIGNSAIVLCNFGVPDQELFLAELKENGIESRLVMGVGGAFDYLTGKLRRAPRWMRALGLEWLWRLILQPRRLFRIWNAVVIFPIKIICTKKGS